MRFFLIDKVTELQVGALIRGVKAVTLTDEVLHDHFPDHPVLPGTIRITPTCAWCPPPTSMPRSVCRLAY